MITWCTLVVFDFLVRSAIYANRNVLSMYHKTHPDLLAQNGKGQPHIRGNITGILVYLLYTLPPSLRCHLPATSLSASLLVK